jgi:N-acetylglucosamine kinase-like BadF-type ATPase
VFVGVDGGGSKTAFILVDREGAVRATHVAGGSYYLTLGMGALGTLISTSLDALLKKGGVAAREVEYAFLGLPAYGEDREATAQMERLPASTLAPGSWLCGNDMICGWAGSLACRDGINVVAGTGSICYGERNGAAARCGGWGELFSDEGSAYWIACRGLDLFSRMSDGRAMPGALYHLVRQRLGISDDLELCSHVYVTLKGDRALIAQLCPLVVEAAASGDVAAAEILTQGAEELALLVTTTRARLGFRADEQVDVSYSGGVFECGPVRSRFAAALASRGAYRLCEPEFPPVIGAALYAARRRGSPLPESALARLRASRHEVLGALKS